MGSIPTRVTLLWPPLEAVLKPYMATLNRAPDELLFPGLTGGMIRAVAKELGHKNVSRVEDTYGHPNHFRRRGEVVEYRV